jgi:hypothetical protein
VQCTQINGADGCAVEFGYAENGAVNAFYGTPRAEATIATGTSGTAFGYETTEGFTPASFTTGKVTIVVPGISGRTVFYRVKQFNGASLIYTGAIAAAIVP